jgi:hypothetical protein
MMLWQAHIALLLRFAFCQNTEVASIDANDTHENSTEWFDLPHDLLPVETNGTQNNSMTSLRLSYASGRRRGPELAVSCKQQCQQDDACHVNGLVAACRDVTGVEALNSATARKLDFLWKTAAEDARYDHADVLTVNPKSSDPNKRLRSDDSRLHIHIGYHTEQLKDVMNVAKSYVCNRNLRGGSGWEQVEVKALRKVHQRGCDEAWAKVSDSLDVFSQWDDLVQFEESPSWGPWGFTMFLRAGESCPGRGKVLILATADCHVKNKNKDGIQARRRRQQTPQTRRRRR